LALSIRDNLRDNPQDISGWSTLALVNSAIGRLDESVAAYEKAVNLDASNDTLRFKYSEALMLAGSEDDLQTAVRQMDYLISKDASNRNYRLLFTTIAIKLQDVALAQQHFEVIKDELDPNSQFYQSITNELSLLGLDFGPKEATHKLESGGISRLVVNIELDGILNEILPANAYLIVFAQNANSNSKAPLAVKRMPLGDLPTQVELSDGDAMIANMNLSSAQQVNVTARISIDENVMPQAGELQGITNNIQIMKGKSQSLDVIINE
jgi:cytochrome c-type biogenesis protein CcmH